MLDRLPKISIITVCFNAAATLERTINSVVSQHYPNLEYIVVDGGSTDGTLRIIEDNRSYFQVWVSERDKGPFDAMNKGIGLATGELIGILNADDWYEQGILEKVAAAYTGKENTDVICGRMQYWEGQKKSKLAFANPSRLTKEMSVNHPTVFVSSEVYRKFGVFDLAYPLAADYELLLRFHVKNCRFVVMEEVVANMSLDGLSDRYWKRSLHEAFLIKRKYFGFLVPWLEYLEVFVKEFTVRQLKAHGLFSLYRSYKNVTGRLSGKGKRF